MWLLQIAFIEPYYEQYRLSEIEKVNSEIAYRVVDSAIELDSTELSNVVGREMMCVDIMNDTARTLVNSDNLGSTCVIDGISKPALLQFINNAKEAPRNEFSIKFTNNNTNQGMYLMVRGVMVAEDEYVYIFTNAPLEMVDSTVYVLRRQFGLLTLLVFSVATIVSLLLSRRLSYPISNMTKSAKKLATGNYDIAFEGEGYEEVIELSETLNYATSEFQKTDELRRDLVANVSHDIKTPLTMIKAYAEMIQDISGEKPTLREEHLNVILEETNHLERLVNDMLTLSKYESNAYTINLEKYRLSNQVNNTIGLFKGLDINFDVSVGKDIFVYADEVKMGQVLYNYINNASKYVGDDKLILIKAEVVGNTVKVSVTDNGPGIDPEILPYIWDRYYKVGKNFSRNHSNSGLGLSIVKAICIANNSEYGVQSELGEGSSFFYTVPLAINNNKKR